jgi:hypothetical protein
VWLKFWTGDKILIFLKLLIQMAKFIYIYKYIYIYILNVNPNLHSNSVDLQHFFVFCFALN